MTVYGSSYKALYFPSQKRTQKQKTEEWIKECIDSAEYLAILRNADDKRKMNIHYLLDNDIIDEEEVERVFNPMQIQYAAFPAAIKNYPLSVPKIDLLVGEEIKRSFDWVLRSRNETAYSAAQSDLSDMLMEILIEELQNENYSEEKLEQRIQEFSKYSKYHWKDKYELTGTRILQYLWREQDLKDKFNRGFRDVLVGGQENYRVDIISGEPVVIKTDPRNVYSIRRGTSERLEDADIIVEVNYEAIGRVVDEFYDHLTPSEIDEIENGQRKSLDGQTPLGYTSKYPPIYSNLDFSPNGEGFLSLDQLTAINEAFGLPYDEEGNIRVLRVRWVGRRKIGRLTYFDENGDAQEKYVSENYKPDKEAGEQVKWIWINEAMEGTKIASDIYVKMGPREVQMRHFDNKSKCFLGYVGTDYIKSLMSRMEPYQYLYNVYMRRLELAYAKYKGPIYELDVSKVPDNWNLDQWMYYAEVMGWAAVNPFNEGKKGAATGKLAGNFNTTGKVLDARIGDYIQSTIAMLQLIERQMGQIAGVTEQRQGQIENRETVGGVERSVTQSSHITEKWFFVHDETKKRVMMALLDTAKYAWRNSKSKKLNFVLDDMSRQMIDISGEDIASTEFDMFISNSSKDLEIKNTLKQLSQAAMQNGNRMSIIVDVLRADSITEMARMLDTAEEDAFRRQQQQAKEANETNERIAQLQERSKQADRDLKKYEVDTKASTEIQKTIISNTGEDKTMSESEVEKMNLELDKFEEDRERFDKELQLKKDQLNETTRHNKEAEKISRIQKKTQPKSK